jgi:hypothetical protein
VNKAARGRAALRKQASPAKHSNDYSLFRAQRFGVRRVPAPLSTDLECKIGAAERIANLAQKERFQ